MPRLSWRGRNRNMSTEKKISLLLSLKLLSNCTLKVVKIVIDSIKTSCGGLPSGGTVSENLLLTSLGLALSWSVTFAQSTTLGHLTTKQGVAPL